MVVPPGTSMRYIKQRVHDEIVTAMTTRFKILGDARAPKDAERIIVIVRKRHEICDPLFQ